MPEDVNLKQIAIAVVNLIRDIFIQQVFAHWKKKKRQVVGEVVQQPLGKSGNREREKEIREEEKQCKKERREVTRREKKKQRY